MLNGLPIPGQSWYRITAYFRRSVKDRVTQGRYNDSNSRLARAGRELAQDEGSAYSFAVDLVPWWNRMRQSDPESLTHIELRRDPAVPSIR
jgi:hypothetical protein